MATAKKESTPKKTASKPAAKTTKAKSTTADAPATTKKTTAKKASSKSKSAPATPAERYRMIEVAAYYIAEKNQFAGSATDYWIQAEIEINAKYPE